MAYALVVECDSCGQANRIPIARVGAKPLCGSCKHPLPARRAPIDVGDDELEALVRESPLPLVVDFWAPWCGPCRMIGPPLAAIAASLAGKVLVAKVNVDENPNAARAHDARSIPLLVAFAHGKPVSRQVGALPPPQLRAWIDGLIAGY